MFNGGYVMVDCTGLDLIKGQTPQTVDGIYTRVENAVKTGKPIYACGCNWGGRKVSPIQVFVIYFDGVAYCTSSTLQIVIDNEDTVTINNMAPANG